MASEGRVRMTPQLCPKRSGGLPKRTFLPREEWAQPRGRKSGDAVAASQERRSRRPARQPSTRPQGRPGSMGSIWRIARIRFVGVAGSAPWPSHQAWRRNFRNARKTRAPPMAEARRANCATGQATRNCALRVSADPGQASPFGTPFASGDSRCTWPRRVRYQKLNRRRGVGRTDGPPIAARGNCPADRAIAMEI